NQQHLFTITRSGALYRADLATGIEPGEGEDLFLSRTFQLRQNYPNPFNPETLIEFHLPTAGHVRLTVFNTLGQVVKVLVDQTRQAGPHQVRWNATDQNDRSVASGPYFYRLESSGKAISKSMLLLR
ncbi:MAG TPA: T9SS type A sorting domain-containing protein, partial [Calditrichia bacterium]|nr:T9SS type A sorting domain-containing protein [Calditrichia bacterium]